MTFLIGKLRARTWILARQSLGSLEVFVYARERRIFRIDFDATY